MAKMSQTFQPFDPFPHVRLLKKKKKISTHKAVERIDKFLQEESQDAEVHVSGRSIRNELVKKVADDLKEKSWVCNGSSDCFIEIQAELEVHLNPCYLGDRLQSGLRRARCHFCFGFVGSVGCGCGGLWTHRILVIGFLL